MQSESLVKPGAACTLLSTSHSPLPRSWINLTSYFRWTQIICISLPWKICIQAAIANGFIFIRGPTKSLDVKNTHVPYSMQPKEMRRERLSAPGRIVDICNHMFALPFNSPFLSITPTDYISIHWHCSHSCVGTVKLVSNELIWLQIALQTVQHGTGCSRNWLNISEASPKWAVGGYCGSQGTNKLCYSQLRHTGNDAQPRYPCRMRLLSGKGQACCRPPPRLRQTQYTDLTCQQHQSVQSFGWFSTLTIAWDVKERKKCRLYADV